MSLSKDLEELGNSLAPREKIEAYKEQINDESGYTSRLKEAQASGKQPKWGGNPDSFHLEHDRGVVERKAMYDQIEQEFRAKGCWTPGLEKAKQAHEAQAAELQRIALVNYGAQGRWDIPVAGKPVKQWYAEDPSLEKESRQRWAEARAKCGRDSSGWGRSDNNF